MKQKPKYPGVEEAERMKGRRPEEEPDVIETASGFAPNYDKFPGWTPEQVLVWCNMD